MVKVGFVVEGRTEKLLIESVTFAKWCESNRIEVKHPVIDAKGGGNLCRKNLEPFIVACKNNTMADHIVVLTDLECDPCITLTKDRIGEHEYLTKVVVSKKAIESWLLADTDAMRRWLGDDGYVYPCPEETPQMPWDEIKSLRCKENRGPGSSKVLFMKKMLNKQRFSFDKALLHPGCGSIKYFAKSLLSLVEPVYGRVL